MLFVPNNNNNNNNNKKKKKKKKKRKKKKLNNLLFQKTFSSKCPGSSSQTVKGINLFEKNYLSVRE